MRLFTQGYTLKVVLESSGGLPSRAVAVRVGAGDGGWAILYWVPAPGVRGRSQGFPRHGVPWGVGPRMAAGFT
jgi:hypothetical protein